MRTIKIKKIISLIKNKANGIVLGVPTIIQPGGGAGGVTGEPATSITAVSSLITRLTLIVQYAAGAIAIAVIIWGAIVFATSGGNEQRAARGKKIVTYGVLGIFLVVMARFIAVIIIMLIGGNVTVT